jgi:hypothetical protein
MHGILEFSCTHSSIYDIRRSSSKFIDILHYFRNLIVDMFFGTLNWCKLCTQVLMLAGMTLACFSQYAFHRPHHIVLDLAMSGENHSKKTITVYCHKIRANSSLLPHGFLPESWDLFICSLILYIVEHTKILGLYLQNYVWSTWHMLHVFVIYFLCSWISARPIKCK